MAGTWLSCPHCLLFFLHPEHTPQPSQCPGCAQLLPPPAEDPDDLEWFYIENRQKLGPVKLSRLQELAASGQLPPDGMVLEKGTSKWAVAADVPGLFAEALAVAPEATPYEEPAPTPVATVYEEPAPPPPPAVPATPRKFLPRWFYQDGGQQVGPVGFARLRELADAGQLQPHTVLLQQGADEWEPASRIDGLFPAEPPAPPPATPPVAVMPTVEPTPAAPGWFYVEHKRKVGPVGLERLQELIDAGQLSASDMVLPQGSAQWVALQALPELAPLFAVADAPAPVVEPEPVVEPVAPAPLAITEEPTVAAAIVEEVPEEPPIESVAVAVIEEVPAPVVEPPVAVALSVESAPATPIEEPEPVAVAISVEPPPAVNGQPVPAAVAVTPPIAAPPVVESAPTVPAIDPDELVRSFESAWLQGKYPELEAYLPATDELRRAVAPRLACIDLQCRLNCKEAVRVETYLERFPALAENRPGVLDLLALEFRLRRRGQSDLTTEEYSQRFPQYGDELRQRLEPPAPSRPVPRPSEPEAAPAAASFPSIPDHEILGIHGESARAVVYRARHCKLNRPVALKLLAGPPGDPVQRQKLFAEARAAARVHHPHIVEVYEVGEHAGRLYCSLEWLDGEPLARRLTGAPLPVREAVELTVHLTDALQAAHTQDVFHGQLHPSNVLLDAGSNHRPKLINLGMRPCGGDLRGAEAVLAGYRAPEQAEGRIADIGPLSDMHALGVLLFELLTGRPPFRGETVEETLRQVRSQEPSAPSELNDRIPADLDAICLKCLQKEPTRRYTSAEELAADLKRFQSGQRPRARAALHPQPAVRFARRYPLTAAILAGLLL
ncbi:MAG: DUF4339 domain-containing protein, partial [Planctomycetia bacterium]|nr:DUF4339 domain-containing protein [Planctomycetia bacterium]